MTYIKLLTVLAGLALLTACGGAAPPANNTGDTGKPAVPCDTNPFGSTCLADTNLNPRRVEIVSECTDDDSGALCEDAIEFVCDKNFRDKLCDGIMKYEDLRNTVRNTCLMRTGSQDACNEEERINTCDADAFSENCADEKYMTQRERECEAQSLKNTTKCMATEERICGATGDVLLPFCDGITAYYDTLKTECAEGKPKRNDVECEFTAARICGTDGDIFDDFCTGLPTTNDDRQTACLADIAEDPSCDGEMGIATVFCKDDPFHDSNACMADTYLSLRLADCIMAGNAGESKCDTVSTDATMNTAITACLENPFATACESVTAFTSFALARMNRLEFCNDNMNVGNLLCMGASRMGVCGSNPFNASCFTDKTYLPTRLAECIKTENAEDMRCDTLLSDSTMNTAITACLTNPFTDACTSNVDFMTYAGDARTNRESFCGMMGNESKAPCTALTTCQANLFAPTCGAYFEPARIMHCMNNNDVADCPNVTYGDWVASFSAAPLATVPVNRGGNIEVGFLSGLTKTQPTITGFTTAAYASVTLADHNLGGDTDAGFAIWFGNWDGNVNNYYSGILTTTNVGTPLNNDKQDGTWRGRIRAFNSADINLLNRNFTLTVNFGDKEIHAFFANSGSSTVYEIEGSFEGGLLSGSVEFGQDTSGAMGGGANGALESGDNLYVNGTLTGLIGADGAVGAFIGKISDVGFSGGFVAVPPLRVATHATFKTYYADSAREASGRRLHPTPTTTNAIAAFLEGTATGLDTTDLTFPASGNFMPVTVRLKEEATGDNGFAVMYGLESGNQVRFRAGLLSGTDLGPALSGTSTATWAGSLHWANVLSGLVRVALPTVTVDFDNGTIKAPAVTVRSDRTVAIDGLFRAGSNNNDLPVGVLGGKAIYTDMGNPFDLPLIGLIGTEGAIGVYHGLGRNLAGGFQASPN